MKIVIKGFVKTSLLDWDGHIVSTLYVPACNMRCPYCQNADLLFNPKNYPTIDINEIKDFYIKRKGFLDGICLTGGEPTLYEDLIEFLREFKDIGAKVKLDTNGTSPSQLRKVIENNLADYFAMDVKAPLVFNKYKQASGIKSERLFENIKQTIHLIMNSEVDYEFRTTVVPTLHKEDDIISIAEFIKGARKYALQNFQNVNTLDKGFEKIKPYRKEVLESYAEKVRPYVKNVVVRGKGE